MRPTSFGLVFCAAAAWLLVACATAPTTALEPPIVHLSDLRIGDISLFEQRYVLALRLENPPERSMIVALPSMLTICITFSKSATVHVPPIDAAMR